MIMNEEKTENKKVDMRTGKTNFSIDDLYCIEFLNSYRRCFNNYPDIREKADELYEKNHILQEVEDFCADELDKRTLNPLLLESEMPKRYRKANFNDYKPKNKSQEKALKVAKEYVLNIDDNRKNGKNLIFAGYSSTGTGKTYLSCCIAKALIKKAIKVKFINVIDMINTIKQDFKINQYTDVPVLIIDDLGKEKTSEWVCEQLYAIINKRYSEEMPTILTIEGNIDLLRENYDERGKSILSRLLEYCDLVPLVGEDYRTRKKTVKSTYHDKY